jgi:acyl-CoA thioester hydrolase
VEVRIYYEDTDCGGVVYYGNYLKYFERARTQYLEERGLSVAGLMKEGTVFVVVHAEVDYRSPARYGDRLIIETVVSDMTAASFTFSHVVRERESQRVVVNFTMLETAAYPLAEPEQLGRDDACEDNEHRVSAEPSRGQAEEYLSEILIY